MRRYIGQQLGAGGRAILVGHHLQVLALLPQPQHGAGKIVAAWRVQPAGPQNQMARLVLLQQTLALQLGLPIHIAGRGQIGLGPGARPAAIKHIIGRKMHHGSTLPGGLCRQQAHRSGIYLPRQLRLGLGLVYRRIGGGVHDQVGLHTAQAVQQGLRLAQVAGQGLSLVQRVAGRIAAQCHHLAQRCQAALQLPAQLAMLAQQQDFHGAPPYCCCTHCR